jgi:hypothetical protein
MKKPPELVSTTVNMKNRAITYTYQGPPENYRWGNDLKEHKKRFKVKISPKGLVFCREYLSWGNHYIRITSRNSETGKATHHSFPIYEEDAKTRYEVDKESL